MSADRRRVEGIVAECEMVRGLARRRPVRPDQLGGVVKHRLEELELEGLVMRDAAIRNR